MEASTKTYGFVCPLWAQNRWDKDECTIEATTEEDLFVVLDHSLQVVVYHGKTREECEQWLGVKPPTWEERMDASMFSLDLELFFDIMEQQRGPEGVVTFIEDSGAMTCPYCCERYYSEKGHPRDVMCPQFGKNKAE